ncbi:MAG: IS66 family transposase [Elusimicrobiota bacterium]
MSSKKELLSLSKRELVRRLLHLEEELQQIKNYLKAFDNPHTPSSKQLKKNTKETEEKESEDDSSDEENKKPRFPGKPKGSNGGGIKLPEPDRVEEHTLDVSPVSGLPLGKPIGYRVKTIVDFPDKPIQTIEHRFMQYKDPKTGEIVEAKCDLSDNIYGKNLQSIVIMLKNLTNSHDKISDFIRELGAPTFSSRTVQNIATKYIFALESSQAEIVKKLKKESYLHSDETGFREDGKNGYVWGIFTKTRAMFFAAKSRAAIWFKKLIKGFKGVIVVDGYGGYDYYPLKQRCWSHLIREFKDYAKDDKEVEVQYRRLKSLYEILQVLNEKPPDEKEIRKAKWILNDIVTCLKSIKGTKRLRTYIENGGDDWFTALYYEGVPLHNNHAERELRSVVLLRKTIGCYRNWKGKRWIDIVLSVIHTWRLQGQNIFQNLRAIAN